jgi:MFS family permease
MNAAAKPGLFYGYIIIITSFFIMLIFCGAFDCYGIFFDSLITEFGWSRAQTSGAMSINSIMFGLTSIPIARLCSKYSPRMVIMICGIIMGIGYLLLSRINAIWQLYLIYDVLIAIGMGAYISLLPMATRWFTRRRSFMTGVLFSGMGLGGVIFPPIANWLISIFDWRYSFAILGAIIITGISIASQFLRREPREMGLLPFGETLDESRSSENLKISGISLSKAMHTRQFWLVAALYFTFLFCQLAILTHIVIYALDLNISPARSAVIISIFGVFQIAGMNVFGFTADKCSNRLAVLLSFILTAVSFIWLLAMGKDIATLYIFAAIFGFGSGGTQMLFSPITAEIFGLRSHGVILATTSFIGSFGAALGAFSAGLIFDFTQSYTLAFFICTVLAVMAAAFTALIKPLDQMKN